MNRNVVFFGVANVVIFAMLIYLVKTGQLARDNVLLVGAICLVGVNGLIFLALRRRRE